jgi:hypothetical protein
VSPLELRGARSREGRDRGGLDRSIGLGPVPKAAMPFSFLKFDLFLLPFIAAYEWPRGGRECRTLIEGRRGEEEEEEEEEKGEDVVAKIEGEREGESKPVLL